MTKSEAQRQIGISGTYVFHYAKPVPGKDYQMQECGKTYNQRSALRIVSAEYIEANRDLKWCRKCFG